MNEPVVVIDDLSLKEMFEYVRMRELVYLLEDDGGQDDLPVIKPMRLRSNIAQQYSANDEVHFRFNLFDDVEKASFQEVMISTEPEFSVRAELQ